MVYNIEILCNYWIQLLHRSLVFQVIHGRVLALSRNAQSHQLNCRCSSKTNTCGLVWPTFPQDGYIILMGDWSWNCQGVHFEAVLDLKQAQQVGLSWDSQSGRHLKQDGNLGCGEWFFCRMWVSGRSPPGKLKLHLKITQLKRKSSSNSKPQVLGSMLILYLLALQKEYDRILYFGEWLWEIRWLETVFFLFDMCEISRLHDLPKWCKESSSHCFSGESTDGVGPLGRGSTFGPVWIMGYCYSGLFVVSFPLSAGGYFQAIHLGW